MIETSPSLLVGMAGHSRDHRPRQTRLPDRRRHRLHERDRSTPNRSHFEIENERPSRPLVGPAADHPGHGCGERSGDSRSDVLSTFSAQRAEPKTAARALGRPKSLNGSRIDLATRATSDRSHAQRLGSRYDKQGLYSHDVERIRAQDVAGWLIPIAWIIGGAWQAVVHFDRGEIGASIFFSLAFFFGLYLAAGLVRRRAEYLEAIRKEG